MLTQHSMDKSLLVLVALKNHAKMIVIPKPKMVNVNLKMVRASVAKCSQALIALFQGVKICAVSMVAV